MRKSDERILTTHVGSLPRDAVLSDLLIREELGETVDRAELARLGEKAVHHVVAAAGCLRRRRRQRRRAAAGRLPDLRGPAHEGLRRRIQAAAVARLYRFSGFRRLHDQAHAAAQQGDERTAGDRRRGLRGSRVRPRMRSACSSRRSKDLPVAAGRDVHDGGGARHHRHHHAERALRHARGLRLRARPPDAQGIRADRARLHPADRCAGPRAGAHRAVPGQDQRRVRRDRRDACRGAQRGAGRHPARSRAAALLLGQQRGPAHARHPAARDPAGALLGEGRRAQHRVRQPAPPARIRRAQEGEAAARVHPDPRRDRHHDQLRRAPRGRRQPDLRGGRRRRRPQPRHRLERLRLRHLRRLRDGRRRTSSGPSSRPAAKAPTSPPGGCGGALPPRRRPRLPPSPPASPEWRDRSGRPCRSGRATGCWPGH